MFNSVFLLHGGGPSRYDYEFYQALTHPFSRKKRVLRVLSVPFALTAMSKLVSNHLAAELNTALENHNPRRRFITETADGENIDHLIAQIEDADIIYAHGGNGDVLQAAFCDVPLKELVSKNKVCAGNSAGANMWVTNYYSNDNEAVMDGLKIIPVNTMCHYTAGGWLKLNHIRAVNTLPIIPLGDSDWIGLSW